MTLLCKVILICVLCIFFTVHHYIFISVHLHTSTSSYQVVMIHKHLNLIQHWRVLHTTLQIFLVNLGERDSLLKTSHAPNVQCRTSFKSSFRFISLFRVLHKSGNKHSWLVLTNSFLEDDWFPLCCWFSERFKLDLWPDISLIVLKTRLYHETYLI